MSQEYAAPYSMSPHGQNGASHFQNDFLFDHDQYTQQTAYTGYNSYQSEFYRGQYAQSELQQAPSYSTAPHQTGNILEGYYPAEQSHIHGAQTVQTVQDSYEDEWNHQIDVIQSESQQQQTSKAKAKARKTAALEDGQPRSKRAERRAKILEEHGTISATDVPKGITRQRNGVTEWLDQAQNEWHLAAPLDNYRHHIIAEDNANDDYDHAPDHGRLRDDITTFPRSDPLGQKHWNLADRSSWGNIRDAEGNEVMYLLSKPDTDIETPEPGFMMYNEIIMLDPDDHPVMDWPGIPRCFSSNIEGGRIEALRRVFPWLPLPQFRARMPRQFRTKTVGVKGLFGLSTLTQRLARFRQSYDCPPWKKSHVSKGADQLQHTKARLVEEGLNPNSTAGLQPLSRKEMQKRKEPFMGQFPENKGLYTLTDEQRALKEEREARRQRGRKHEALMQEQVIVTGVSSGGGKRKREITPTPKEDGQPPSKRVRSPSGTTTFRTRQPASPPGPEPATAPMEPMVDIRSSSEALYGYRGQHSHSFHVGIGLQDSEIQYYHAREPAVEVSQQSERDMRTIAPQTYSEQASVKAALSFTIADYRYFHGCYPPETTNTDSYLIQYQCIGEHHRANWLLPDPAPKLINISEWLGSFNIIPVPTDHEEIMQRLLPPDGHNTGTHPHLDGPQSSDALDLSTGTKQRALGSTTSSSGNLFDKTGGSTQEIPGTALPNTSYISEQEFPDWYNNEYNN